ncbi:MAG: hypothetical protein ABIX44_02115 [Cryobacterium sp.]
MLDRTPEGQEGPDGLDSSEARGEEDLAAAIGDGAPTGSHDVVKAGFDTDLPDDADDVWNGAAAPRSSPRVADDEQVIQRKKPKWLRWKGRGRARRSPPES